MARILVVEDEPDIALGLKDDLERHGYEVDTVGDGESAHRRGREPGWDLILLDLMLPGRDGFAVCRELRRAGIRTPVIMLTARTHEDEKVLGLGLGADDYVTKPFRPRELRARIQAVLRRVADVCQGTYRFGDCEVDFDRGELRRGKTKTAPMITECPLNLECTLVKKVTLGGTDIIIIGEIVETYCEEQFMTNRKPDVKKMGTYVFSMHDNRYFSLGKVIGKAWSTGNKYKASTSDA